MFTEYVLYVGLDVRLLWR